MEEGEVMKFQSTSNWAGGQLLRNRVYKAALVIGCSKRESEARILGKGDLNSH